MVPVPLSRLQPSRIDAIEDWPWLDQDVLRSSRSQGWTDDMVRQRGWAPEVA
jgi:hypothetical protein